MFGQEPVSPNTQSWWKLMAIGPFEQQIKNDDDADLEEIDAAPGSLVKRPSTSRVAKGGSACFSSAKREDKKIQEGQSEERFLDILDNAVCNVEALGSPAIRRIETVAQGWGLLSAVDSVADFPLGVRDGSYLTRDASTCDTTGSVSTASVAQIEDVVYPNTKGGSGTKSLEKKASLWSRETEKINGGRQPPNSLLEDGGYNSETSQQSSHEASLNKWIADTAEDLETIEAEDVETVDGSRHSARLIVPKLSATRAARGRSSDFSVEISYASTLETIDEQGFLSPTHGQSQSEPRKPPRRSSSRSREPTVQKDSSCESTDVSVDVPPHTIDKILQPSPHPHLLQRFSSLTEDSGASSAMSWLSDDKGEFKSGLTSTQKRKTGASGVKPNATASTTSIQSDSDYESTDDQSLFSSQYKTNAHHAYTAYFQRGENPLKSLRVFEHPTPAVFPTLSTEIVVKVEYATISHTDCAVRQGVYWGEKSKNPLKMPVVPGVSFTGTIIQISKSSMRAGLRHGDRVTSLVRVGSNSRHLCIARDRVVRIPPDAKKMSMIACIPEVILGAFQALHITRKNSTRYKDNSMAGKHILVVDGASVHGAALIDLARVAGATNIYATAKEKNFRRLEAAGAIPVQRDPKFWFSLLKGRIDMVIALGSYAAAASVVKEEHVKVLNKKGQLVVLGPPEKEETVSFPSVRPRRKIVHVNVFDSWEEDTKLAKRDLAYLVKLVEDGQVQPRILDSVSLAKISKAQEQLENKRVNGFVVCEPWIHTGGDSGGKHKDRPSGELDDDGLTLELD